MTVIPKKCHFIFDKLNSNGFQCYAVGGCIRDSLMGTEPLDWDFTTDAEPDDIISCFNEYDTIDIGKNFGTICVICKGEPFEITTFRNDGDYSDMRHPDSVTFTRRIEDDLSRRDFTVNAIAYSPEKGYVDPFGGMADINAKLIRCVGDADNRFSEDAIRILRAIRFSSRLGFAVDPDTKQAIHKNATKLSGIHPQRIRKELSGILMSDSFDKAISDYSDVLSVIIPELSPMFALAQNNPHHKYDVWTHTLQALSHTPSDDVIRFAVLFHDIGKPHSKTTDNDGVDHFKNHQKISCKIAEDVMRRFAYPTKIISDVSLLVRYHDERFRDMSYDIKRVLGAIGPELFEKLLLICRADILAQSEYKREQKLSHIDKVEDEFHRIVESGECYSLSGLCVDGSDLITLGFEGKAIGYALDALLSHVVKGKAPNTVDGLRAHIDSLPRHID